MSSEAPAIVEWDPPVVEWDPPIVEWDPRNPLRGVLGGGNPPTRGYLDSVVVCTWYHLRDRIKLPSWTEPTTM